MTLGLEREIVDRATYEKSVRAKFTHQVQHWYKLELRWDRHIINSILMIG